MAITKIQSESLNLADDFAFTGTITGAGESNVPAFAAYGNSSQSMSNGTNTKIQFQTEIVDTNNAFDNSTNYRFTVPSGQAGKYFFGSGVRIGDVNGSQTTLIAMSIQLWKNGSGSSFYSSLDFRQGGNAYYCGVTVNGLFDLSENDYIESYGWVSHSGTPIIVGGNSYLIGYKVST